MGHLHADRAARFGQRPQERRDVQFQRPGQKLDGDLRRLDVRALQGIPKRPDDLPERRRHGGPAPRLPADQKNRCARRTPRQRTLLRKELHQSHPQRRFAGICLHRGHQAAGRTLHQCGGRQGGTQGARHRRNRRGRAVRGPERHRQRGRARQNGLHDRRAVQSPQLGQ